MELFLQLVSTNDQSKASFYFLVYGGRFDEEPSSEPQPWSIDSRANSNQLEQANLDLFSLKFVAANRKFGGKWGS